MANNFLQNNAPVSGPHENTCFCTGCRQNLVENLLRSPAATRDVLHRAYFSTLAQSREEILDMRFTNTKEEVIMGYTYKQRCLQGTGYRSFGCWLAQSQDMTHLTPVEKDKLREEISVVTTVYENWETIVENLTMPSMAVLEPRSFSIRQFARAVNINWCIRTRNNQLKSSPPAVHSHEYDEAKFQEIMALVRSNGLLADVSHSRNQAKLIAQRFQNELLDLC